VGLIVTEGTQPSDDDQGYLMTGHRQPRAYRDLSKASIGPGGAAVYRQSRWILSE
jgi:hypothetical protein